MIHHFVVIFPAVSICEPIFEQNSIPVELFPQIYNWFVNLRSVPGEWRNFSILNFHTFCYLFAQKFIALSKFRSRLLFWLFYMKFSVSLKRYKGENRNEIQRSTSATREYCFRMTWYIQFSQWQMFSRHCQNDMKIKISQNCS